MGREVRRVPPDWQHPKKDDGHYQPMYDRSFAAAAAEWKKEFAAWERGERSEYCDEESKAMEYWEYNGMPPEREYYMPDWRDSECTHFQMYETTSEGTPISPVMPDVESLARWLADNNASAFASETATYEQWLSMCNRGWAPSAVYSPSTGLISGVAAMAADRNSA